MFSRRSWEYQRSAEKYQQTTDDSRSGIPRPDSVFPTRSPTAHSPYAPTLYWSTELLCYCAPFPEVNISETSEMLCRYEAWTHPQLESDVTRTLKRCHCVGVPMLPMNIMRCKHSKQAVTERTSTIVFFFAVTSLTVVWEKVNLLL